MAITWKTLSQSTLTGTAATVYTPPDKTSAAIHTAQAWNPTAAPVTVEIYVSGAPATASDSTKIESVTVPAASSATVYGLINQKLQAGYSIMAKGNDVTLTLSGAESVNL